MESEVHENVEIATDGDNTINTELNHKSGDFIDNCGNNQQQLIQEFLDSTKEQNEMFNLLIKNQIEVKDKMIDSLHEELQRYKNDQSEKFVEQLMKAVIKIRKDMNKLIHSEKWNSISLEDLKTQYCYTFEDLTDLLELQGVVPYSSKQGDKFDGKIHQAKTEHTDNQALDKKIKESISEGYQKNDRIMIPERVVVYSYEGGQNE